MPAGDVVGRSLTAFSQTDQTTEDQGGRSGRPVDPDLRLGILTHRLDVWH